MNDDHEHIVGIDTNLGMLVLENHREFVDEDTIVISFKYCPLCGEKIKKEKK